MVQYFEQMTKEDKERFTEEIRKICWIKENAKIEYTKYYLNLSDKNFWESNLGVTKQSI